MHLKSYLSAIILGGLCVGCGTVLTRTPARGLASWNGDPFPRFYPATCVDGGMIYDPGMEGHDSTGQRTARRIGYFCDLPISLATDTLFLPFDTITALSQSHTKEPNKSRQPTAAAHSDSNKP